MKNAIESLDVYGSTFPVSLNKKREFTANINGEEISAPSFDGLKQKAAALLKKTTICIPIVSIYVSEWDEEGGADVKFTDGTITGIHSGNGNYLVKFGERREQVSSYGNHVLRDLNPQERDHLVSLWRAKQEARKAWEDYLRLNRATVPGRDNA